MVLNRLCDLPCNPRMMSAQTLAFVGDAVFDLIIRERLSCKNDSAVGVLNNKKVSVVCCKAQAELIDNIWDNLSDEEKSIYKRGRNAHVSQIPKNASGADYHKSTGLEALIGYLYLSDNLTRIKELLENIYF